MVICGQCKRRERTEAFVMPSRIMPSSGGVTTLSAVTGMGVRLHVHCALVRAQANLDYAPLST